VDGNDEPGQELAVQVGRDADGADGDEGDPQGRRAVEDGIDERAVRHGNGYEQPCQPVRGQPALVADAGETTDRSRPTGRTELRRERPDREHEQPRERDVAQSVPEGRLVGIGRRGHEDEMRHEEQDGRDSDALVPDGDAIEAAERALDRVEEGRQHEAAREQEHGLGLQSSPMKRPVGSSGGRATAQSVA